ncbi:hypothetical protein BKA56DRAFT_656531 [Ilyonectria sp. MPI-CAGE-AT-0026]|nr:hypothetical protein BKA56DRAFT_656531 [Ilyonectria sp. MPI-CAGE-AT-0026]
MALQMVRPGKAVQVGSFSHCCAGHSKTDRKPCLARPDMPSGPTPFHVPPPPAPSQSAMIGLNRKRESSKPDLPCSVPSGFLEACAPASYWELGPSSCSATYLMTCMYLWNCDAAQCVARLPEVKPTPKDVPMYRQLPTADGQLPTLFHVTDQLPDPAGNPLESLLQDFIVWRCGRSFFSSPVICPWHLLSLRPRHLLGTPCSQTPIASPSFLRVPSIHRIPHCGLSSAVAKRKETDLRSSDGLSNYNLPDLQIPSVSHAWSVDELLSCLALQLTTGYCSPSTASTTLASARCTSGRVL